MSKAAVHAVIRRMSDNPDGKITFREFSLAITPELAGLPGSVQDIEFNEQAKIKHQEEQRDSPVKSAKSIRGGFRQIQLAQSSPVKQEF